MGKRVVSCDDRLGTCFIGELGLGVKRTRPGGGGFGPGLLHGVIDGRRAACRVERAPGWVAPPRGAKETWFC